MSNHGERPLNLSPIGCVSTLLSNIKKIEDDQEWRTGQQALQYYRGLSKASHKLQPSVMRDTKHYENEGAMLRDLITRQPDEFAKFPSALDQWMLAQHHGLCTRFLDITANPLVGLYFACNKSKDTEGLLYVFATTRDRVKPYDSDAVSIIANFARLRRCEQEEIRCETEKFLDRRHAFITSRYRIMHRPNGKDVNDEVSLYAYHMKNNPTRSYMGRLQTFIRQEKPYFVEGLIDPRDLFRIFIVQPRRLFPRVRAQSGAFLVSAHHETFDFDRKVRYDEYRAKDGHDVPYNFYRLTVEAGRKRCILKELESLNISEETLFPELEKSAKAIVDDYKSGDLMTCAEMLRREGEAKGRRAGRLETIDGLLRAGIGWPVVHSATGIDEPTYRILKRAASPGTEQAARQKFPSGRARPRRARRQ